MKSMFSMLFRARARLSNMERLILDCVRNNIDKTMAVKLNAQIKSINKIQRLPGGVEVDFYRINSGRPSFPDEIAFKDKKEFKIAEVRVTLHGISKPLIATVWCINGFLFSIEYDTSPSYFEEAAGTDRQQELSVEPSMISNPVQSEQL